MKVAGLAFRSELSAQLRLCSWWLGVCLAVVFVASLLIGPGGYGGALLALVLGAPVVGLSWLALQIAAVREGWPLFSPTERALGPAIWVTLMPALAAVLFVVLALPVVWFSGWIEPYAVLLTNKVHYDREVDRQRRTHMSARDTILVWQWGGSVDSDLDIVWDSFDRPAQRLKQRQKGGDATCRHLMSHYYNCGIWY
ncbi:MAG: hypothetical protein ABIT04_06640 [Novosphingobium sp.]